MKKNKTAWIIVATMVVLSIIIYFLPLESIIGKLPLIKGFYNNTSLEIISQRGKATININGESYGETPATIEDLPEGEYVIELTRIAEEDSFYKTQTFTIELARNTSARIDIEIGPEDILHGTILYYTPAPKSRDGEDLITITSSAENARIYIDDEYIKTAPISGLKLEDGQYQIRITASGYEEIEIPVFIRKGYHLNLKTYHFPIPLTLESADE